MRGNDFLNKMELIDPAYVEAADTKPNKKNTIWVRWAAMAACLCLVVVGSITIDCRSGQTDPMSEAFLQMAGVFSQLELAMIRARVRSGMANAKAKGKKVGRPQTTKDDIPAVFYKHYPAFSAGKMNLSELARICNLSRPTVYKYLKLIA